jgi:hypothetical protein
MAQVDIVKSGNYGVNFWQAFLVVQDSDEHVLKSSETFHFVDMVVTINQALLDLFGKIPVEVHGGSIESAYWMQVALLLRARNYTDTCKAIKDDVLLMTTTKGISKEVLFDGSRFNNA